MATVGLKKNDPNRLKQQLPKLPAATVPTLPQRSPPQLDSKKRIAAPQEQQKVTQITLPKKPVLPSVQITVPVPKNRTSDPLWGVDPMTTPKYTKPFTLPELRKPSSPPVQLADKKPPLQQNKINLQQLKQPAATKPLILSKTTPNLNREKATTPRFKQIQTQTVSPPTTNSKLRLPQPTISSPSSRAATPSAPKADVVIDKKIPLRSDRLSALTFSDL